MRTAASWIWGTHGRVEVDTSGNVQVAVRAAYDRVADRDGYARADVANVQALQDLLDRARSFAKAVFPPPEPGRPDLEYDWEKRADAYRALDFCGKMPDHHKPEHNAKVVTDFLRDWQREAATVTMMEYAKSWERWW